MPFMTINQVAKAIGYSHAGASRFLRKLGVPRSMVGGCYYIYLSDMNVYCPELLASIMEAAEMNKTLGWVDPDAVTEKDE